MKQAVKTEVSSVYYRPAVSIILPFEPKMTSKPELTLSLKNATEKIEYDLKASYTKEVVDLMMDKIGGLLSNLNYSTHKRSIAIYVSPVFEKVLYLDIPVNEKVKVDDTFDMRDLVYNKRKQQQYLVLVLCNNESRIFIGHSQTLKKMVSNTPQSVYAYINEKPEKVGNFSDTTTRREIIMDKFLHHVDKALDIILNAYHLPLFVIGTERISGHFKSLTRHTADIVEYVKGSYGEASEKELAKALQPYIDQWEILMQKKLLSQLDEAAGKKKLATGMREVWKEAMNRKGRLLLLEKDYFGPDNGSNSRGTIYMPSKRYNNFSNIRDAVDDVIQAVLENGGDVEIMENDMLKDYQHIALVKYY